MRKYWIITFFNLVFSHFLLGQQVYFSNRYDFARQSCDVSNSILVIQHGYLVAAEADSICAVGRIGIIKLDTVGKLVWEKKYGSGSHSYTCSDLIQSSDGNYIYVGGKDSGIVLIKFDQNGDSLWTRTYFNSTYYFGASQCKLTVDKGFIIIGLAQAKKSGLFQVLLIKTDSLGKLQWQKIYSNSGNDYGYSIDTTNNGGYIIGSGWNSPELIKSDSSGNIKWQYTYSGYGFAGVTTLREGGYAFSSNWGSSSSSEAACVRVDRNGKQVWSKQYPPAGNNTGADGTLIQTHNYGFVVAGQINDSTAEDGSLLRIDSSGNLLWYRNYRKVNASFHDANYLRDVKPTADGGFIASGFCSPFVPPDTGTEDVWVLKVDSNGCDSMGKCSSIPIVSAIEGINSTKEAVIYPNPNNGRFTIAMQNLTEKSYVEIYNMLGKKIYYNKFSTTHSQFSIDISNQPQGIYLYRIISDTGQPIASGKLIIQ